MSTISPFQSPVASERGVVLILTAILIPCIFLLLAFALDLSRLSIAQAEHKQEAALGSLAALTTYWESLTGAEGALDTRHRAALQAARKRAERLTNKGENLPLFSSARNERSAIDVSNAWDYFPSEDSVGVMHFGFWHYHAPVTGCSRRPAFDKTCPCRDGKWAGPCFERQAPRSAKEPATAIQLESFTPLNSPFRWLFGSGGGVLPRGVRARATVSLPSEGEVVSIPRIVENIALPPYQRLSSTALAEQGVSEVEIDDDTPMIGSQQTPPRAKRIKNRVQAALPEEDIEEDFCNHGSRKWSRAGNYSLSVPSECDRIRIWVWGAGGAGGNQSTGGAGGFATGVYEMDPDTTLRIIIGSGGDAACLTPRADIERFGGGGPSQDNIGWGGGFSGIFANDTPLIFAAGGGAGGERSTQLECESSSKGGAGGGLSGQNGESSSCLGSAATGGTQNVPGKGAADQTLLDGKQYHGGLGGGGGGVFGGGGTNIDHGGAAGGSGFVSELIVDGKILTGVDEMPPATELSQYESPAGQGGTGECKSDFVNGRDGFIVVAW